MTAAQVHQVLHGYRSGHGQLSASVKLPDRESELITRLSDLSGSLSSGLQLNPYLTIYPLPGRKFVAVARTWPDPDAPRAGCVMTHTLLVPVETWAALRDIRSINKLFCNPRSIPDHNFTEPLRLLDNGIAAARDDIEVEPVASRAFVSRYFGQGLRPIVWFNAAHPEETLWRLLEHMWPRLRVVFSCCTFSLQQRNLEEGPFDLLFAPSAVYSRFTKLSAEHLIEPGTERKGPSAQPWSEYWARAFFAPQRGLPLPERELPVWDELGEDPTAVRKLSLIQELRHRAAESATAGVGAIDVVESLAHEPTLALNLKRVVLSDAIKAAVSAPSEGGLMSLRLIEDRLRRDSFRTVADEFRQRLSSAAANVTTRDPDAALQSAGDSLAESLGFSDSAFAQGVIIGLRDLAANDPSRLGILRSHPEIAAEIFRLEPTFAATYLQVGGDTAPSVLAAWLSSTRDLDTLRLIRKSVLPVLPPSESERLLPSLLRDLRAEDVKETLSVLAEVSRGFSDNSIQDVVGNQISSAYPDIVREWGAKAGAWSAGIARIVAATYAQGRQGFDELLREERLGVTGKADVLTLMIRDQISSGHPYWLREIISNDVRLVMTLLLARSENPEMVESGLSVLLDEAADLPLAKADNTIEAIATFDGRPIFPRLFEAAMRSVISCYVSEGRNTPAAQKLTNSPEASRWLQNVPSSRLIDLLTQGCYSGPSAVARAWKWVSEAPRSLYQRRPNVLPSVCDSLLRFCHQSFSEEMEFSFLRVLRRSSAESDPDVRHTLSAKMLRFALDHVGFPLGGVVAETFADAYAVAVQDNNRASSIFSVLFGSYNWDRGKELRVSLIDAFLRSRWLPGDLALAANNAGILRKIFKRLRRRDEGDSYISMMVRDLCRRDDPQARNVREQLESMVNAPNFYEQWD